MRLHPLGLSIILACSSETPDPMPMTPMTPTTPMSVCGDGVRQQLEQCDRPDLAGASCVAAGFEGGQLACSVTCAFDTSGCTGAGPECGNGALEGLELCDGSDLGTNSCAALGFDGGTLGCNPACTFDVTGCTSMKPPSCGDGVLDPGEACDGNQLGGQNCTDVGFVAGALSCNSSCEIDTTSCLTQQPYDGFDLAGATGCEGVYNVEQVLTYHLDMPASEWTAIQNDTSYTTYHQASFRCLDGPAITVGVRRKRSGGAAKPGLKIDFNTFTPEQTYYDLHKLSFEIGQSSGGTTESDRQNLVAEYLANRLMVLSGARASRTSLAELVVNGTLIGVYVNVEQIDKRFLRDRLGDDSGWLYKKSGGIDDGFKTNETMVDPYDAYFCFFQSNGCNPPSSADLAASLPSHLDMDQFLRVGAVNALVGNTDSPIFKDNNYYFYDYAGGPRLYFAWDLDTTMNNSFNVFTGDGIGGARPLYTDVLFTNWEDDWDLMLSDLLNGSLSLAAIEAELDRAQRVASAALDADPVAPGTTSGAFDDLRSWWQSRHADVSAQVAAH